jgi:hypothetical protein
MLIIREQKGTPHFCHAYAVALAELELARQRG